MSIARYESLRNLTLTLSKSEKRHFVLFANRVQGKQDKVFLRLFELMEQYPNKKESELSSKLGTLSSAQFTNAKRNLYNQLLHSLQLLRDTRASHKLGVKNLQRAVLLYERGLISQSLTFLKIVKSQTNEEEIELNLDLRRLQQKIILSQPSRLNLGPEETRQLICDINLYQDRNTQLIKASGCSLLSIVQLQHWGFVRNEREDDFYDTAFNHMMTACGKLSENGLAKKYWHLAWAYHHKKQLKFESVYSQAQAILSDENRLLDKAQVVYVRAYHLLMTACFHLGQVDCYHQYKLAFLEYLELYEDKFSEPEITLSRYYESNAQLNALILNNRLASGLVNYLAELDSSVLLSAWKGKEYMLDFKLGLAYSYCGRYNEALNSFDRIYQSTTARLDVLNYARLIAIICHYRLNNFTLVLNMVNGIRAAFDQADRITAVIEIIVVFLRKGSRAMNFGIDELVDQTLEKLEVQNISRFGKVDFLYYDFTSLMSSIKANTTIEKIRKSSP